MRPRIILATLFAGAFTMGCAEMLVVGLIDLIASDVGVSLAAAGALVTANALGLAFGGPVLTFLTTRFDRRLLLIGALGVFVLANLLPVLGAGHALFIGGRVLIGAAQGLFIAAGITTATSVVPAERAGRAMAVVISGFATASALGLPLGTLLGQAIGWRGAFAAVDAVASAVLIAALVVLPSVPSAPDQRAIGQARHAFAPRVLALLALCLVIFTGIQSALTYIVPFLDEVTGIRGPWVSAYLLAYGVATTLGSAAGGRFADANAARALVGGTIGVTVSLLSLLLFGGQPVVVALATLGIGLFGMGMAPSMQHRVAALAGAGAPLAASLPASAVNAGIAAGSLGGGLALTAGGPSASVLTGVLVAASSILVAGLTARLRAPAESEGERAR